MSKVSMGNYDVREALRFEAVMLEVRDDLRGAHACARINECQSAPAIQKVAVAVQRMADGELLRADQVKMVIYFHSITFCNKCHGCAELQGRSSRYRGYRRDCRVRLADRSLRLRHVP